MTVIKTPDQRLRVFISSTIQELSAERKTGQELLERMKLTPVFFESGARPHPPRDLYRSYLEQSDVFVGIYWKSYGWTAPDMEISGLEDEWRLSGDKPKLIYIKQADQREPRLNNLIKNIQDSNVACYQKFEKLEDLTDLIANDLAILLTERFQSGENRKEFIKPITNLPVQRTPIIGRSREIQNLKEKLLIPELGLITLTGPGGTGKTRLALELGKELLSDFKDGVFFVQLASVTDNNKVPAVIAQSLGMINRGNPDIGHWVIDWLYDKSLLLILDNLEQIPNAGLFISEILIKCGQIKIIATSRTPLYIRNENIFSVEPLEIKSTEQKNDGHIPGAVDLFMQRAMESNASIEWNAENRKAAYSICYKLDGLPLSIELAAARCRHITPVQLDNKMGNILDSIGTGPRDYPGRQQTLRNTIQWSYNLLEPADQRLFRRLAVFENGWTMDALENICWKGFEERSDLQSSVERLSDFGLTVRMPSENDYPSQRLLQVIKEYALEKMKETGEEEKLRELHCNYYQRMAEYNAEQIWMNPVNKSQLNFRADYENIAAAFNFAVSRGDQRKIWSLINSLNTLYLVKGEIGFLFEGLEKAQIKSDEEGVQKMLAFGSKPELALSLLSAGFIRSTTGNFIEGLRDLEVSRQLAKEAGVTQIESRALLFLGISYITTEYFDKAKELLLECISLCKEQDALSVKLTAELTLIEIYVEEKETEKAVKHFDRLLMQVHNKFMPLVESYAYYRRGYLHYYLKEYELAAQRFRESIAVNQQYNMNLNASLPFLGLAMASTEMEKADLAMSNFRESLECLRLSGSNVEFTCFKYALCQFLAKTGQTENALRLFVSIQKDYAKTHYRPWITLRICLDYAEEILRSSYSPEFIAAKMNDTDELSREEIYAMVD